MNQLVFETEHYVFHYGEGTPAHRDIREIADHQERCHRHICAVLGLTPEWKIEYFLCDSPEAVGRAYDGNEEPCDGFTVMPNRIYAVYSDSRKCLGFHEDSHILSYCFGRPDCPAIREGLAMYFDRNWWGISNLAWTGLLLKTGRYLPVHKLLDKEFFRNRDCALTYPIMGAFAQWLIDQYGMENYLALFSKQDIPEAMVRIFRKTPEELDREFVDYVRLFETDPVLEERMEQLLEHI